jgi:sec-independent protein translocase protein TatC
MRDSDEKAGTDVTESSEETSKMSFLDHLDELRKRLVRIAIYLAVGFFAGFYFADDLYNFLSEPVITQFAHVGVDGSMAFTNLTAPFMTSMRVALMASVFLTLPFTLFEVWKFISPGLYRREKKYVIPFILSSTLLFVSGAVFCYKIALPGTFKFLLEWSLKYNAAAPMLKLDEYLDLVTTMILGFGCVFEMPVIIAFLSLFGLVSARFLWKNFNYALVGIVIIAAVLSPTGDAFNLMVWSAPMVALYFVSIGVAAIIGARRKKKGLV